MNILTTILKDGVLNKVVQTVAVLPDVLTALINCGVTVLQAVIGLIKDGGLVIVRIWKWKDADNFLEAGLKTLNVVIVKLDQFKEWLAEKNEQLSRFGL